MKDPDGTPAPSTRRRLSGRNERRGSQTGASVFATLLFGGIFVAAGVALVLIGVHVIPVDPPGVHTPYWVIIVGGASFAGAGCAVWGMAATLQRAEYHRRKAAVRYRGSVALNDYAWNTGRFAPTRWGRAAQSIAMAAFMTLFLSMFNWWAWGANGPWVVKGVVVMLDLLLGFAWWRGVLELGRAIKFGGSHIAFAHFPYRMNEPVAIRWVPPRGMARADRGSFTFRCVEEYWEEQGSGKDRSRWLVHDELCAETQSFDTSQPFVPGRAVEFRYQLPADARPTKLTSDRPVFWEFEARLSMSGLDFVERYLVPVYER